jgi:TonB family protein
VTDSSLPRVTAPYKILKQPKAKYTKAARKHGLEGSVILKITLLANGEIGAVTFVPRDRAEEVEKYGLVESAIQAARKIKFIPKKVNGVLMPVIITREYTFSFY